MTAGLVFSSTSALIERRYKALTRFFHTFLTPFPPVPLVMTLRVNPEVAKALKARDGALVSELESLTHEDVIIKSDPVVDQERFEIF
jgi:hypothetical protein